jgi:bifunctional DNA-binding transcriptional regulator/antitoxin component of YhaV-PrlF toxin-antitoxin module
MHGKAGLSMALDELVGELRVSDETGITLPSCVAEGAGWKQGDRLCIEVVSDDLLIVSRQPVNLADALAGRLTHLFPSHEENQRFLDEERASWEEFDRRLDD